MRVALAVAYVFLWASAFVPSRVLSTNDPPLWILVVRFAVGGALLLALAVAMRRRFPQTPGEVAQIVALGMLTNGAYLGCSYVAMEHLSAGMSSIIASTNPLVVALAAPAFLGEGLSARKIAGLVLGFLGVVIAMVARAGSPLERPQDAIIAFAGVVAFVASTILYKRMNSKSDLVTITALQVCAAAIVLVPVALLLEGAPRLSVTPPVALSFAYVVLVMTIGASFLWFWLLRQGEASTVSAFYFLTPVFGLILAALILHEPLGWRDGFGLLAICGGIFLVVRS